MNQAGYADSYSQKKVSDIKTVCVDAQIHGIETSAQLIKVTGHKVKKKTVVYLDEEEIERIEQLHIEEPHLLNARRWLLLGTMIGQRGND